MKRKPIIITITLIALVATGAIAAAVLPREKKGTRDAAAEAQAQLEAKESNETSRVELLPMNIRTERVAQSRLTEYILVNGAAQAMTDVTFSAEIPGRIEYLGAQLGARVRRGQALAKIDFRTLEAEARQAEAAYELAQMTYNRMNQLGRDLVSQQKIDEARTALTTATAALDIARSKLDKGVVRSTISGIVVEKFVDEAEYVAPGAPMYRIVDLSVVVIEAQLPETQVSLVQNGAHVTVAFGALGETRQGKVEAILPTADPQSKTYTARIKVRNRDDRILAGMSAQVRIAANVYEGAIVVPQDVVVEKKNRKSVFVAEGGVARERTVRLGATEGDRVAIVEGIKPGESLITVGQRSLLDGQPVRIVR